MPVLYTRSVYNNYTYSSCPQSLSIIISPIAIKTLPLTPYIL
nr:MAG TPA: hypothetical protein [Caudoviricetes sp.]